MQMSKNNKRGGKRPGAGRPKLDDPKIQVTIRLTRKNVDILKQHAIMSNTSLSKLIDMAITYGANKAIDKK